MIIPALNEASTIASVLTTLAGSSPDYDVAVVDELREARGVRGSPDLGDLALTDPRPGLGADPAGVSPERGTLPSAMTWREQQRERLGLELLRALDAEWTRAFCSDAAGSLEDAARCAHARPPSVPQAVRTQVAELFGDDPDLVLALPRPRETVE